MSLQNSRTTTGNAICSENVEPVAAERENMSGGNPVFTIYILGHLINLVPE